MSNEFKTKFDTLSKALQDLHRALLRLEARRLATEGGRELTSYELLHASLNEPSLAWLRHLSALIVEIDTLVDESPHLGARESAEIAAKALDLIEPADPAAASTFWPAYTARLAAEPDLILKHARVKDLVTELRAPM